MNIPTGYQQITPYLIVENAAAFISFMQTVFGATERSKHLRDETLIMHAELQVGESVIMVADTTAEYPVQNAGLFIYVENCDATYQRALDNEAIAILEPRDQDYGRSAGVKDTFGNTWWITGVPAVGSLQ